MSEISPARVCAYLVIRRVFEQDSWADRVLHAEAVRLKLDHRDRALATQLAYGVVKHKLTLDYVISKFSNAPMEKLARPVLASLRLGVFQAAYLDRIPLHAAVSESVALVKRDAPQFAGFTNAVLRKAANAAPKIVTSLGQSTPEHAALRHSHPRWMVDLFWRTLGADEARALLAANNEPAETALRANTLRITVEELVERLSVPSQQANEVADGVVLSAPFDAFASPLWQEGLFVPQSRAAMAVGHCLDPQPGEKVLDLCAAPGGKTTHLAALMGNEGSITAVEANSKRAQAVEELARRVGATNIKVQVGDARTPQAPESFDRVLVDPPCSDLGTLRSRPDVRWRKSPELSLHLAQIQTEILTAGASAVKSGGSLVYSTCTLSPKENEDVITAFVAKHPEFTPGDLGARFPSWVHPRDPNFLLTLPHRDETDGFFICRLDKE